MNHRLDSNEVRDSVPTQRAQSKESRIVWTSSETTLSEAGQSGLKIFFRENLLQHAIGRIDEVSRQVRDALIQIMIQQQFLPLFLCNGSGHRCDKAPWNDFWEIKLLWPKDSTWWSVTAFTLSERLTCWPISDFLHLLKNTPLTDCLENTGFWSHSQTITAAKLNEMLGLVEK
jgi:hypothetical protein